MGVENFDRLQGQKSPLELEMMARVRTLFDPQGLFNPGKVFDPWRTCPGRRNRPRIAESSASQAQNIL